jgi:hypothetical protein
VNHRDSDNKNLFTGWRVFGFENEWFFGRCAEKVSLGDECGKFESEWSSKKPGVKLVSSQRRKQSVAAQITAIFVATALLDTPDGCDDTGCANRYPQSLPLYCILSSSSSTRPEIATGVADRCAANTSAPA